MSTFTEQSGEKQEQRTKRFLQFLRELPGPEFVSAKPLPARYIQTPKLPFREWRKAHRAKIAARRTA